MPATKAEVIPPLPPLDIEHLPVEDDPRKWSSLRKNIVLLLVSMGSMIAGFSANIQNPSIADMEADLNATSSQISLTLSLFILFQGAVPLLWAAISEIKGRRMVYLVSLSIFVLGSIAVALSINIAMVIVFRIFQAAGSSAVMTLGAATLADIYDPHERGTKMGIYYLAPLLGPSVAPLLGGALTDAFNWRATFWFLAILAGITCFSFTVFFKDTFRRERSMTYQHLLRQRLREQALKMVKHHKTAKHLPEHPHPDVEKQPSAEADIKLSLKDVNPIKPIIQVLSRINNLVVLLASGLIFGFCFVVVYGTSRTLGTVYHYEPLIIGLVLFSFGAGQMSGSLLGGRWSDHVLELLRRQGGMISPEMRLRSVIPGVIVFPMFVAGFGWVCEKHVHIAAVCVLFFLSGFGAAWVYVSTLAYIVDSNVGRSSVVISLNSCFRGLAAFIGTEVTVPIQDTLGDGWMYTIFALVLWLCGGLLVLLMKKGEAWRHSAEHREAEIESRESRITTAVATPRPGSPLPKEESRISTAAPTPRPGTPHFKEES